SPSIGSARLASGLASARTRALAAAERAVGRRLLASLPNAPVALVLPHGGEIAPPGASPTLRIRFRDPRALFALLSPDGELHFGDAYADGRIEIEGELLDLMMAFHTRPDRRGAIRARAADLWRRARRRRNTPAGSRENVHHHYDLGNDFYALWLDREMVYTCAYFRHPDATLEEAQRDKMELVARKLRLRPGER